MANALPKVKYKYSRIQLQLRSWALRLLLSGKVWTHTILGTSLEDAAELTQAFYYLVCDPNPYGICDTKTIC